VEVEEDELGVERKNRKLLGNLIYLQAFSAFVRPDSGVELSKVRASVEFIGKGSWLILMVLRQSTQFCLLKTSKQPRTATNVMILLILFILQLPCIHCFLQPRTSSPHNSQIHAKIYTQTEENEYYRPYLVPPPTSSPPPLVQLKISGKPRPLTRHRTGKGFVYNPSAKYQKSFVEAVKLLLPPSFTPLKSFLDCQLTFKMNRPRKHFTANRCENLGTERLRSNSPRLLHSGRTDIDNLIKFVLDSLNEVVYEDDRQIISISSVMVYDNEADCAGSIEVILRNINSTSFLRPDFLASPECLEFDIDTHTQAQVQAQAQ